MAIYKDFLGLNYCIYEPTLNDSGAVGGNTLGYSFTSPLKYSDGYGGSNPNISQMTSHLEHKTAVLLNLHRNGPFGYPTWKQIRVSDNHLSRAQRKRNIFTFTEEPGPLLGSRYARFGETRTFTEPVVVDSYKPLSLVGDVSVYNERQGEFQDRSVELKTSFGNETAFFANKEVNEYFDTIHETDDNYEQLKELYLDGGLEDEGSPIDAFNLLVYRQTVFPKQQYAYLDETRSRKYYENLFWRDRREDRRRTNVDGGFGATIPSQSIWPLDAREDFATRTMPVKDTSDPIFSYFEFDIGGHNADNAESGPGILQNRYSTFTLGGLYWNAPQGRPRLSKGGFPPNPSDYDIGSLLTASIEYARLHTLKNVYSPLNPSGIKVPTQTEFFSDLESPSTHPLSNDTGSLFNGRAFWDAPAQAGKTPFYDSYEDFSSDIRLKGKSYSKIPEFRISNHVDFYSKNGPTSELKNLFELSGALSKNDTTETRSDFYEILSTSDFLKHFDLLKNDHKDISGEKIITLKCKAVKKFLPYKGFYPADRTVEMAEEFYNSHSGNLDVYLEDYDNPGVYNNIEQFSIKGFLTPLFAPGILFNTIKSGIAVDFPMIFVEDFVTSNEENEEETVQFISDEGAIVTLEDRNNCVINHTGRSNISKKYQSIYSERIPFEALVDPAPYLANKSLTMQEVHPFGLGELELRARWDGGGSGLYKKMASNFLAEVPDFFLLNQNLKTIASLEEQSPEFGNAIEGNFYLMRIKMTKSRNKSNAPLGGYGGIQVVMPQDLTDQTGQPGTLPNTADDKFTTRETITMYSRPSAFGPPVYGGSSKGELNGVTSRAGSTWGFNFPYTPPYYHGESWCDLIFYAEETKKYSLDEIMSQVVEFPYYTRYWHPSWQDALRDLTGYRDDDYLASTGETITEYSGIYEDYGPTKTPSSETGGSTWYKMIREQMAGVFDRIEPYKSIQDSPNGWADKDSLEDGTTLKWAAPNDDLAGLDLWLSQAPQSPGLVNYNAMQLDSSVNLFGKGTIRKVDLDGDATDERMEVASDLTTRGKTRWIIQPKFETPILNFNKYNDLSNPDLKCTPPLFAKTQVPRGMWHQYGDLPKEDEGIYLQVDDIPKPWLRGALGVDGNSKKIKSLADLVGFSKDPVRLGEVADVKEISEAVVAVPFIEKNGTRQFFSIPRADIDSCIDATRREVGAGTFVAGGPPKAGDSVYQMVKKMKKYVFPPSMDFVRYKEIDPFAMYIFEFKHNLTKQDLADIWQNLPPEIGTRMEEAEATISHELLAHELLGGGAVVKNGTLDDNAEGNGIPSNIQWMVFKAKKRAKTNYFDKVVAKKGTTEDTHDKQLENASGQTGDDLGITYNWPYDFFSLVELVKLDAEVTFANIENDDKGQKTIKKVEKKPVVERQKKRMKARGINFARGKGRPKK